MAVAAKDIPITREQVYGWIAGWKKSRKAKTLPEYIGAKVDALDLPDSFVNTAGHDSMPDQMPLVDFLMLDINSYSNYVPSS